MGLVLHHARLFFFFFVVFVFCWILAAAAAAAAGISTTGEEWRSATATYSKGAQSPTIAEVQHRGMKSQTAPAWGNGTRAISSSWCLLQEVAGPRVFLSVLMLRFWVLSRCAEGGACGYGDLEKSGYGKSSAGLSSALFERGSACGACFELRCVDHILWCLQGSPSVVVTAADFCAPNYGLPGDYGGWCNYPREHFEMSEAAFVQIARRKADIIPVQFRRVNCDRYGGMRFTVTGGSYFYQVLIANVGSDGEVIAVKVKGSRTGWIPMARNWGQNWQCSADLRGQPLSFEVTASSGRTVTSYNVASSNWSFGQTFEGKQFLN
ncbi:expansin-A16 isoform X1 [Phoenix dactylifera]|uniref:Expansin n=1 Tax=Phoenix dactylifera TaxID=42345 RepID=A0A8B9AJ14_PHODC|nr:expansin-A16 isoform X1 [Phoenix dactylifera]